MFIYLFIFLLVIHFIHISVYMSFPISQFITPSPPPATAFPALVSIHLFSTSVSQFLPCKRVHLYHFSRFHMYALICDICFSLSDLLRYESLWQIHPHLYKWPNFVPFYGWVIFHCIYVPHLLYPFVCWWAFRLLPWPGYCK